MAFETSCGALVVKETGSLKQILIIKNKGGNYWGFPKGHTEAGETQEDTVLREIAEETGLSVRLKKGFQAETSYKKENGNIKNVTYFIADPVSFNVKIQESEIADFKWLSYSECMEKLTYKRDKKILMQAETFI